jgi:hypothetical protein
MGSVEMGRGGSYRFEGNTITHIAYCLYCDRCGSFNIGRKITLKMLIWICITVIVANAFWYSARKGSLPGAWFACFGSLLLFVSFTGVLSLGYRCRKCGNRHITTWESERNAARSTIDWHFTIPNARNKLKKLYPVREE